jgi:hypothetical protein
LDFIDYYLDEWHANNYPKMLAEKSNNEVAVTSAFALVDKNPNGTGMTSAEWSKQYGIPLFDSIEKVIADSDCLIVLSPDNPEKHVELCQLALRSGKRTYVDKTFTTTKAEAVELFALAQKHNTPMYSSSSLRFSSELKEAKIGGYEFITSRGPGAFGNYLVHQLEPIVMLMNDEAKRIMYVGAGKTPSVVLEFASGAVATTAQFSYDCPFALCAKNKDGTELFIDEMTDSFDNFIVSLADFFMGNINAPVSPKDTITIMAIIEAAQKAKDKAFEWVMV